MATYGLCEYVYVEELRSTSSSSESLRRTAKRESPIEGVWQTDETQVKESRE